MQGIHEITLHSDAEQAQERQDRRTRWLLSSPALAIIAVFSIAPMAIILVYSFLEPGKYGNVVWSFSLDAWISVFAERDIFDGTLGLADAHLSIFWRSIKLSLLTTFTTMMIGVPMAYYVATRAAGIRNLLLFLITVPFWTNLLIRVLAIQEVIRKDGLINTVLLNLGLVQEPLQMLFTDFAIGFGMTYVFLPLMVLPVYAAVERIDFRLVEAAYDLYASRWTVIRRVIFPIIRPGVIAGSALVFIPSLGEFVIARVLGGGKNLMLGNLIALQFGQGRNWPLGAALSVTMLVLIISVLLIVLRFTKGRING